MHAKRKKNLAHLEMVLLFKDSKSEAAEPSLCHVERDLPDPYLSLV